MTVAATAHQGETLDLVCWRVLGTTSGGVVEAAYLLNAGLAAAGTTLAEGTALVLPDPPAADAPTRETVSLWS